MSATAGTAVARNGRAALIRGASGSGKSMLALQLIALGGELVADDAVRLRLRDGAVLLDCPESIKGMIEARGVGLLSVQPAGQAKLAFVVDLDETAPTRLPEPATAYVLGEAFPLIRGKGHPALAAVVWLLLGGGQILPVA